MNYKDIVEYNLNLCKDKTCSDAEHDFRVTSYLDFCKCHKICPMCGNSTTNIKFCSYSCANKARFILNTSEYLCALKQKIGAKSKQSWQNKTQDEIKSQVEKQVKKYKETISKRTESDRQRLSKSISKGVRNFYATESKLHKLKRIEKSKQIFAKYTAEQMQLHKTKISNAVKKAYANMSSNTKQKISKSISERNYKFWNNLTQEQYKQVCKNMQNACKYRKYTKNKYSNAELYFMKALDSLCVKYLVNSYIDNRYPYKVDFYIPTLDLFIELNIHWTHGGMAFDKNNKQCLLQLYKWFDKSKTSKFYKTAIDVWTRRDVQKLHTAFTHNLNYKVAYTVDDIDNILNDVILKTKESL